MTNTTTVRNTGQFATRIVASLSEVGQAAWDELLGLQADANPFLSFAFLHALHESGSASEKSGWQPQYITLWDQAGGLAAALPLYVKYHSYGEYVLLCTIAKNVQLIGRHPEWLRKWIKKQHLTRF